MKDDKCDFIMFHDWLVDRNEIDAVTINGCQCILKMKSSRTFTVDCISEENARNMLYEFAGNNNARPLYGYYDHPAFLRMNRATHNFNEAKNDLEKTRKTMVSLIKQVKILNNIKDEEKTIEPIVDR
jgi:hypothetical protein